MTSVVGEKRGSIFTCESEVLENYFEYARKYSTHKSVIVVQLNRDLVKGLGPLFPEIVIFLLFAL